MGGRIIEESKNDILREVMKITIILCFLGLLILFRFFYNKIKTSHTELLLDIKRLLDDVLNEIKSSNSIFSFLNHLSNLSEPLTTDKLIIELNNTKLIKFINRNELKNLKQLLLPKKLKIDDLLSEERRLRFDINSTSQILRTGINNLRNMNVASLTSGFWLKSKFKFYDQFKLSGEIFLSLNEKVFQYDQILKYLGEDRIQEFEIELKSFRNAKESLFTFMNYCEELKSEIEKVLN
jgi:hypothetical protein